RIELYRHDPGAIPNAMPLHILDVQLPNILDLPFSYVRLPLVDAVVRTDLLVVPIWPTNVFAVVPTTVVAGLIALSIYLLLVLLARSRLTTAHGADAGTYAEITSNLQIVSVKLKGLRERYSNHPAYMECNDLVLELEELLREHGSQWV